MLIPDRFTHTAYHALCDQFSVSFKLMTRCELSWSRETLLHLFEALRRRSSSMNRLRRPADGVYILDQTADTPTRRQLRLDENSVRVGFSGVCDLEQFELFCLETLELVGVHLGITPLDLDRAEAVFRFDLEYTGNHHELLAEAFLGQSPLRGAWEQTQANTGCMLSLSASIGEACSILANTELRPRTGIYDIRAGEFHPDALSTLLRVRRCWSSADDGSVDQVVKDLLRLADGYADARTLPSVVMPLSQAIASRR